MKLMISQPMRGKTDEAIMEERQIIKNILEDEGHTVVNTLFDLSKDKNAVHYLAQSIKVMADVDGVVFTAGWQNARGCRIEYQIASEYGKYIKFI